jgi:UDP-glucose 4-epimerase
LEGTALKIAVTGGAGFIGRWLVKKLLSDNHEVIVLDNLSNGNLENIMEFQGKPNFTFSNSDVTNKQQVEKSLRGIEICLHLAAQINVQESLDLPNKSFESNVVGTYNVLESCRKNDSKIMLVGTCMVYDFAFSKPISEEHPIKLRSPYAGSKAAAEDLAISYFNGYGLPVAIARPFNTYGPFQKSNMEGGVVSIFAKKFLANENLQVYGNGEQTRDLLYVEDCSDFLSKMAFSKEAVGQVINAGTGKDISINDLAFLICKDKSKIKHVEHHHLQSEIPKLVCDYSKAKRLLKWEPQTSLKQGIAKTIHWIKNGDA